MKRKVLVDRSIDQQMGAMLPISYLGFVHAFKRNF
jgi:hypothetical protein